MSSKTLKLVKDSGIGDETGIISDFLMKDVSVNLKGSSFLEGHGVERSDSEEKSLSFWRYDDEDEGIESSKDSAI